MRVEERWPEMTLQALLLKALKSCESNSLTGPCEAKTLKKRAFKREKNVMQKEWPTWPFGP